MRLDITTTGTEARGSLILNSGKKSYRAHYADVDKALYRGVAKALQLARGLRGVSIDGVELEQSDIIDRLKAYHAGGYGRGRVVDEGSIDLMIEMVEEGDAAEFSAY